MQEHYLVPSQEQDLEPQSEMRTFSYEIENELFAYSEAQAHGIDTEPWRQAMIHKFQNPNFDSSKATPEDTAYYAERIRDVSTVMRLNNWRAFDSFPEDTVRQAYEQSPAAFDSIFADVVATKRWERPVDANRDDDAVLAADNTYKGLIKSITHVTSGAYGNELRWREAGVPNEDIPAYMQELAAREGFAAVVAQRIPERKELSTGPENQQQQLYRLRQTERVFMEKTLGIPPEIARKTRQAIESRTMIFDDKTDTPFPMTDKRAGIEFAEWQNVMTDMADALDGIPSDDVDYLHDETGIVNFDMYTNEQLVRMINLFDKDPETISAVKDGEVTALIIDANSYNNAFIRLPKWLEESGPTVVFEASEKLHFYKPLLRLEKRTGIVPSRLGIGIHGFKGGMAVGEGAERFTINAQYNKKVGADDAVVEKSAFGSFLRKYLRPRRDSGEREVTLFACSQAAEVPGMHSKNVPETIVRQTNYGDRVVVRAPEHDAIFLKTRRHGLRYSKEGTRKSIFPTTEFRLASRGLTKRIKTDKTDKSLV